MPSPPGEEHLLALPDRKVPDAVSRVLDRQARADLPIRCGARDCRADIGSLTEERPPDKGFCPRCGKPYSYEPALGEGDTLGEHYTVRGPLANGGQGWVYLAHDAHLDDKPVAVKGLLNRHDEEGARRADSERRNLIAIRHPRIVRILDYVEVPRTADEEPTSYIVMEYVGDLTLAEIAARTRRGQNPLGAPLDIEHVLAYGVQILEALGHLRSMRLVYGDMKPSNVIHEGTGIKVIDLGGVQPADGANRPTPLCTPGFAAPEVKSTGVTVAHDIHCLGRTLAALADCAVTTGGCEVGIDSFRRTVARATHRDPAGRFAEPEEMAEQLRFVAREIRALRGRRDPPRPSRQFVPSVHLLGDRLGTVPGPEHWLRRPVPSRRAPCDAPFLDPGTPTALEVARGLPAPTPRPGDSQEWRFGITGYDPAQPLGQPPRGGPVEESAEVCLHNVRLLLWSSRPDAYERAARELEAAGRILGSGTDHPNWRLTWHHGLLALWRADRGGRTAARQGTADATSGEAELRAAQRHFLRVHGAVPGEYAPKLALAYCAERLGEPSAPGLTAEALYRTVLARNPSQGGAALGLARIALADGDRERARRALERVPPESRDHAVVRIAEIRVRGARLRTEREPDAGRRQDRRGLVDAARALHELDADSAVQLPEELVSRLATELDEWLLDTLVAQGQGQGPAAGTAGRRPAGERAVRFRLDAAYRTMAGRCGRREESEHLVDLANSVRPRTRY
ncbi:tetratricopeptide repeat protein [Streptomyces sp. NPDC091272]|uniref:serine/threonine-protein kinase n=1 Tax=Streptomyces sp. NPDC091272 TaxID=3365981 RepID=UPI00381F3D9E